MFKIIREHNPNLPIIILSAPKYDLSEDMEKRHTIIEKTHQNAVMAGDKKVRFISGKETLKEVKDIAFADNVHPGDVGFHYIAKAVTDALKELFA